MRRFRPTWMNCILAIALALALARPAFAQEGGEDAFIADRFQRMSSDVRIGQLFVVAFDGTDASTASDIAQLILDYHVGGVILSADHANIVDNGDQTPVDVAELTSALQLLALRPGSLSQPDETYIPLFIALEQDGGGPAYSAITSGLTPYPNPMAIGATWNRNDARAIGQIVGQELSALGINLLLGPSLDTLTRPDPDGGDAGVLAFGGDPYWVGAMARAYVQGLRDGSEGHIAAVLKHFPGQGGLKRGSDTIDASLDQLRRFDLLPYYNLMRVSANDKRPLADAVLTTHARFRGFSTLRERTAPVSADSTALTALLQLPEITAWRAAGGLMVSGSLGDPRLRAYYDSSGAKFAPEQIALEAFLAGNDVLVLDDFSPNGSTAIEAQNIRTTIEFFQQQYREDLAFQNRVDDAVKRILRLKYRLYPDFRATEVVAIPDSVAAKVQQDPSPVAAIAQDAITRILPPAGSQATLSLPTPAPDDRFLIFTDDRLVIDCGRCPVRTTLFTEAIAQAMTQLFGAPSEQITSRGFADLKAFVNRAPAAEDLSDEFAQATWIILAQQNLDEDVQQSDAARLLLRNQPGLLAGKRVTLFTFGPPYELAAEDLSRITAGAYVLYDIDRPFVETAVSALFGEIQPRGASPVSLEAIGYDLVTQTEPDPNQLIALSVGEKPGAGTPTPESFSFRVGDNVVIRTGLIADRNGNPVPDDTPVQFTFSYPGTENPPEKLNAATINGSASVTVTITFNGLLEIDATSEPALNSVRLLLTIAEGGQTVIQTIERPTPTPTRQPTAMPTLTATPTPTATPVALIDSLLGAEPRRVNLIDFAVSLLGVALVGAWGYRRESKRGEEGAVDRATRLALLGALCGLAAYTYLGLGLPGADAIRSVLGSWSALAVALLGAIAPWLIDRASRRA